MIGLLFMLKYTELYIQYCIYSTVKSSLEFQKHSKFARPGHARFSNCLFCLRLGARDFLICSARLGNFLQYCIYSSVYTVLDN